MQPRFRALASSAMKAIALGSLAFLLVACKGRDNPTSVKTKLEDGLDGPPGHDKTTKDWLLNIPYESTVYTQAYLCHTGDCGGQKSLKLEFRVVKHAKGVEWHMNKKHDNGQYLVKINNRNPVPYEAWDLPANDSAFLWVGQADATHTSVGLYQVDSNGGVTPLLNAVKVGFCFKAPNTKSEVHFTEGCISPVHTDNAMPLNMASHTSGLWVSCSTGCCEVQFAE